MSLSNLWPMFLLVLSFLGLAVAAMAVGVIFKRPCLRGSCGGPALHTPSGEKLSCATCPNRHKHAHAAQADDPA